MNQNRDYNGGSPSHYIPVLIMRQANADYQQASHPGSNLLNQPAKGRLLNRDLQSREK